MSRNLLRFAILLAAFAEGRTMAQPPPQSLAGASLEDLLNVEVTSVSKKEQSLAKTGAAVFVINQEDIRRSGANNIPDLLRMAPGVEVAQIDGNQWAVSIRGFNNLFSNKVLVLIDGRTVYSDSFSGVYWDQVRLPLEDIERIEVIRGPGGTVWGANAVNGVINIITKSAADTKGGTITSGAGSKQTTGNLVQFGGNAGSEGAYRAFAGYSNTNNSVFPDRMKAADGWHAMQAGIRADWKPTSRDAISVQGDFLQSSAGATSTVLTSNPVAALTLNNAVTDTSGDVLAHWTHSLANGSEASLQVYDSAVHRKEVGINANNNTLDIEFQHHIALGARNDLVWGLDYRFSRDSLRAATEYAPTVSPAVRNDHLAAVFVEDEFQASEKLFVTVGTKFEHNSYSGFELEPSVQLVWKVSDRHSLWTSASHAVREPDHIEYGVAFNYGLITLPGVGPALVTLRGNPHIEAEHLDDFEVGYRAQWGKRVSLDVTSFLSVYKNLVTDEPGAPVITITGSRPSVTIPVTYENLGHARTFGGEVFASWMVSSRWKLAPGFSTIRMTTGTDPSSQDQDLAKVPGNSPRFQPQIRSSFNLSRNLELDGGLKYVSELRTQNVPGYARLDLRLGWKVGESVEISVAGQDLATPRHIEFVEPSGFFLPTEVARRVFGKITWRF